MASCVSCLFWGLFTHVHVHGWCVEWKMTVQNPSHSQSYTPTEIVKLIRRPCGA